MTNPYQTSRRIFTAAEHEFTDCIPRHLRSVRVDPVNGMDETDGWRLTAHRSEYRQAYAAITEAIKARQVWTKVRTYEAALDCHNLPC